MTRPIPIDRLNGLIEAIRRELHTAAREGLRAAAEGAVAEVRLTQDRISPYPPDDTGELGDSWQVFDIQNGHEVRATAEHAAYMDLGTSPAGESHGGASGLMPPIDPLFEWVERHFDGDERLHRFLAFWLQAKIFEEGLEPREIRAKAWPGVVRLSEPAILDRVRAAFQRVCGSAS